VDKFWKMCLNWRVIAAVVVVALGVLVFAPRLASATLPLLFVAICPLSMILMMRSMQGGRTSVQPKRAGSPDEQPAGQPRLADLKGEVARLREQQDALDQQIARLEGSQGSVSDDHNVPR